MIILPDSNETRLRAAQVISKGGCVAFRADTFYGLGVDPFNREALSALRSLKGREEGKPILVVVSDSAQARRFFAEQSELSEQLSAKHWPGALTLVMRARPELSEELTAGTGTIGVRLPDDDDVRALVHACGGALTATSANPSGEPPARNAQDVARYFPEGLELIIDRGETRTTRPSTVLDISNGVAPLLLREGVVTRAELQRTLRAINVELPEKNE